MNDREPMLHGALMFAVAVAMLVYAARCYWQVSKGHIVTVEQHEEATR